MLSRVLQPLIQCLPPTRSCLPAPALAGDSLRDVKVDEEVGVRKSLPHRGNVGVLLTDLSGVIASPP